MDDAWAMIRHVFCKIFCPCKGHRHHCPPTARVTLRFGAIAVTFNATGGFMTTLPDDKVANATIAYVDAKDNAAQVEGAPVWTSSDAAILSVVAAADGMSAVISPVGPLGTAQVKIEADADLGAGVTPVITLGDFEVVAGSAVTGNLSVTVA